MADKFMLTSLSPREAVADALHRFVLGADSDNRELLESACLKDESMEFIGGGFHVKGWTAINELFQRLFTLITTHTVSNPRIELKDEHTAFMTAHLISYHVRPEDALKPEDTSYTASTLYSLDLVKSSSDGLWKIKKWDIRVLWTTGDIKVLHPEIGSEKPE